RRPGQPALSGRPRRVEARRRGGAGDDGSGRGLRAVPEARADPVPRRVPAERLEERRPQLRQARLELRRHLLDDRLPDEPAEMRLEAIALAAVGAQGEMRLCARALGLVQLPVEERLEELLALRA